MKKIAVGISGGVDSMVAAKILIDRGYDIFGVTMYLYDEEIDGKMVKPQFLEDSKKVCEILGIEHIILDLRKEFFKYVREPFVDLYLSGKTPNPCAMCNKNIKYGVFLDKVIELGATHLAMGHYVDLRYDNELKKYRIFHSKNTRKDQSFLLYSLSQSQLSKLIFPLSNIGDKSKIREIAKGIDLDISSKKDSFDICFVSDSKYDNYIRKRCSPHMRKGNFIDINGKVLGQHNGIFSYTIGQRKGLIPSLGKRMFVIDINPDTNEVMLGEDKYTYSNGFTACDYNFIVYDKVPVNQYFMVKVCQWGLYLDCYIERTDNGIKVNFKKSERAISVGQSAVFYKDGEVIGGCVIKSVF